MVLFNHGKRAYAFYNMIRILDYDQESFYHMHERLNYIFHWICRRKLTNWNACFYDVLHKLTYKWMLKYVLYTLYKNGYVIRYLIYILNAGWFCSAGSLKYPIFARFCVPSSSSCMLTFLVFLSSPLPTYGCTVDQDFMFHGNYVCI